MRAEKQYNIQDIKYSKSNDGSVKFLWNIPHKGTVETIYVHHDDEDHGTICVSTQIGCNVGCKFCNASTNEKLVCNLEAIEIAEEVLRTIEKIESMDTADNPDKYHISYMGVGEPMYNLLNVLKSKRMLMDKFYVNADEYAISTSGHVPGIEKLIDVREDLDLHISLHATTNKIRQKLIPKNKTYPIDQILNSALRYGLISNKRIKVNYILIENLNDSESDARALVKLLNPDYCFIILSHLNKSEITKLKDAPKEKFDMFKDILEINGFNYIESHSKGIDIEGGCGQMRSNYLEVNK